MSDNHQDILDAMRAGPMVLQSILHDCTDQAAQTARGGDENWSVIEVVCHLRDAEERARERMRAMRDDDNPFLPAYDQEAWARERNYAAANLQTAFAEFVSIREQHIKELEALSPSQWERVGNHVEQGRITIINQQVHMVAHDFIHAAQIARQLGRV